MELVIILLFVLGVLCVISWVHNICKLFSCSSGVVLALRILGVFFIPVGIIMGCISNEGFK